MLHLLLPLSPTVLFSAASSSSITVQTTLVLLCCPSPLEWAKWSKVSNDFFFGDTFSRKRKGNGTKKTLVSPFFPRLCNI